MTLANDATCLLVLLTGIPAAGKSSFANLLRRDEACRSAVSRCVQVTGVFRLDDFLTPSTRMTPAEDSASVCATVTNNDGDTTPESSATLEFSPGAWHEAACALYAAVREALQRAHTNIATPAPPLAILVEDNFHYFSMRERYWRLCREVDTAARERGLVSPSRYTLLLELRFTVPLAVCLQRNAARQGGQSADEASHGSADGAPHVPPSVVCAMHSRFDHRLAEHEALVPGGENMSSDEERRCWRLTVTTQPWTLLTLRPVPCEGQAAELGWPTVEKECRDFVSLLADPSSPLRDALRSQHARRVLATTVVSHTRPEDIAAQRARCDTIMHQLDLDLRAHVRSFFIDVVNERRQVTGIQQQQRQQRVPPAAPTRDVVQLRKEVQRLKSNTLQALRQAVARETMGEERGASDECARETVMMRFYEALSHLRT